ncbi:hypothetical protein DFH07DRAFT_813117 [Mycena maculata]|uniref:Uncharacterized protein n=1 Tax=Mycena maculata TaxID=230809 RepID=A0AAD7JEI9_9AGAR|nr:hypothetical protein DFH07DRAFT_813117 [Mycena maculata]
MSNEPPELPPELERNIFESAAILDPQCMPMLLRVAQRVKIWIEPLLFGALSTRSETERSMMRHPYPLLCKLLASRPPTFWETHVRHLCFAKRVHDSDILNVLNICRNIDNLAILDAIPTDKFVPFFETMHLRRLSIRLAGMFAGINRQKFSNPLFAHITHLDIRDHILDWGVEGWGTGSELALIPQLTHLSFHEDYIPSSICEGALEHCKALDVLAILWPSHEARLGKQLPFLVLESRDPRCVMLAVADRLDDWEMGARGGEDYWAIADKMVQQRRALGTLFPCTIVADVQNEVKHILERSTLLGNEIRHLSGTAPTAVSPTVPLELAHLRQNLDILLGLIQEMQNISL